MVDGHCYGTLLVTPMVWNHTRMYWVLEVNHPTPPVSFLGGLLYPHGKLPTTPAPKPPAVPKLKLMLWPSTITTNGKLAFNLA
ncbi:hypothetical protein G9A89_000698 [Geosiphon pyriformis]|nr:hypothetical protein G9A89_000698 [Geosiphon pyriformis]